eukprot:scaffold28390_cov109-Isochrysis_galbana.AAC.1
MLFRAAAWVLAVGGFGRPRGGRRRVQQVVVELRLVGLDELPQPKKPRDVAGRGFNRRHGPQRITLAAADGLLAPLRLRAFAAEPWGQQAQDVDVENRLVGYAHS